MKKSMKYLTIALVIAMVAVQSVAACTIFAVGKNASVDGSTMTSHTCDSTSDDLRLWLIPSMEAGTERDVVLNGRAGADYGQFPEVKDYGTNGMVLGSYTFENPSNQYIHAMYSFINDKGLAMGESTCSMDSSTEHGKAVKAFLNANEGIYDCYMLQDIALEVCSTAREAVELMGALVSEYGWSGSCECINICDGEEAWVFETYGGYQWVAARVPDDMVFVAANRARINFFVEDDPDNYLYSANIKQVAIDNGLWDGEGDFVPCYTFAPYPYRPYSTLREWRAMTLLDPSLDLDPREKNCDTWPCFVKPAEKVSVQTIKDISSDTYTGTEFDTANIIWAGQFGDVLNPATDFTHRTIGSYRCTYIQIAQINNSLPEEARCLAWFGYGAPQVAYLTPIFASVNSIPESFSIGLRSEYNEKSGWWNSLEVQQTARINYASAIQDVKAVRDPLQQSMYARTAATQELVASMIEVGLKDQAIQYLTQFVAGCAKEWFRTYDELNDFLTGKYMLGAVNSKTWGLKYTDYWTGLANSDYVKSTTGWSTL